MATLWRYLSIALAVLAVAAVIVALSFRGSALSAGAARDRAESERDAARAQVTQLQSVIDTERAKAQWLADIAAQYEQDKTDALDREARLRADLGTGNVKLRHELGALYTAQLSQGAAHSAESAAAAERGAELAAAAVRVGAQCDARDRAWRAVAEADRAE